jgi:dienelactone hydrolase
MGKQFHAAAWGAAIAIALGAAAAPGVTQAQQAPAAQATVQPRFAARLVTLSNGVVGRPLSFPSANPANWEDIVAKRPAPAVTLDGQLFMPARATSLRRGRAPVVIITPGSGGVSPAMVKHAEALTDAGLGVFIMDPFAGRGVVDTIADQSQFTFAGSAHDVLAAAKALMARPDVDPRRVAAMGYSRGGIAVLMAADRRLSDATLGRGRALRAVVAGWPWCGVQFARPKTGDTAIRILAGAVDNWVSPVQCQAQAASLRGADAKVSMRLFQNASHGFGYDGPLREIPQAQHSLLAPILYLDDAGRYLNPYDGTPMPGMEEAAIAPMLAPWSGRGVRAGTLENQSELFINDVRAFFTAELK